MKNVWKIKDPRRNLSNDVDKEQKREIEKINSLSDKNDSEQSNKMNSKNKFVISDKYQQYYLIYFWNNFICCNNINQHEYSAIESILSFDFYIEEATKALKKI